MPKRILHVDNKAKARSRSLFIDSLELCENLIDRSGEFNEVHDPSSVKRMEYIRPNQNNEIERFFLRNSKMLLYRVDHCDFPSFNIGMWQEESTDMLTCLPSCAISVPRPIFLSNKQHEKIDICYKRPMSRYFFKTRMKTTKTSYLTALKSNKNIRSSVKDKIYHYSIFEIAERFYMQPDPFFQSSYDFYFTGGNLCVLRQRGNIIHAGGEKLQEMMISEFPVIDEHIDSNSLRNVVSYKNYGNCEIFEYQPLITSLNGRRHNCFVARQRNLLSFNYINDENQLKTVTQFRTKSTPFISFAQSERNINNFIITTMKQHVRLYDLSGATPALVKLFEISPNSPNNSWNTVKPWRENTFMYANENQFFMIDIRTSPEQWLKEVTFANNNFICEHISAVKASEFNNLFYVATNHKLQCMDIRYLKKCSLNGSIGGICRWSHQLRYAPLMMDTFRLRQTEYVALSSPIAGDLNICQLSRERTVDNICLIPPLNAPKHIYSSHSLPYQPPTVFEAFQNARLRGKCLRGDANLEARFKCCTTGMKFSESPVNRLNCGIGLLLTSNSNGDVFAYTLSKREDKKTDERYSNQSDEMMKDFEENVCGQIRLPLNYTEIGYIKGLRKVFLCKALSSISNEYKKENASACNITKPSGNLSHKRLHLGRWQKPLSSLHSFKDALAPDLLSIWDIDIEEENNIRLTNLSMNVKTDPVIKVEDWLKKNINQNPPMLSIPTKEVLRVSNNGKSNSFDVTSNISQNQNKIDFKTAVHSTLILDNDNNLSKTFDSSDKQVIQIKDEMTTALVDKMDNKKKNKKYVKGF